MTHAPLELSYSRIGDLGCPYFYQAREIRGVDSPDSFWAHVGTLGHAVIAEYVEVMTQTNIYRVQKGYGFMPFHGGLVEKATMKYLADEPAHVVEAVRDALDNFMSRFRLTENSVYVMETRLAVDRTFTPCKPDAPRDRFGGTPDMVEINAAHGYTRITDNKMGWMKFGMGELIERADGTMSRPGTQLRLYAALYMMCNPDVREVSVRLVAPRFFSQDDHAWTYETAVPWAQERISSAYTRLDDMRAKYGEKDWPCEATANCQYCSLSCPDSVFDIYEEAV